MMQFEIKNLFFLLAISFMSLMLFSCSYRNEKENTFEVSFNSALLDKVSYQLINQKILIPKCLSCHGDSGNVSLESYSEVYGHIEKIKQVSIASRKMPKSPYPALTREELVLLATWIQAGAPERSLDGTDQPPPVVRLPLEPTFKSINQNILQMKCFVCHAPGKEAERVSLDSAESMINSPLEIVIPGNSEESGLIISISPNARKIMPPKKSGITPLKPEEIAIIKQWIDNGAKD